MNLSFLKRRKESFSARVKFSLVSTVIFTTFILSSFYLQFEWQNFHDEINRDGTILTTVLASNARLGIFAGDKRQISESLKTTIDVEGIVGACAYNLDGKVLHRETNPGWDLTKICTDKDEASNSFFKELAASRQVTRYENKKSIEFWSAVWAKPDSFSDDSLYFANEKEGLQQTKKPLLGYVSIFIDKKPIRESIGEIVKKNILILFFFIIGSLILSHFIIKEAVRPLTKLVTDIKGKRTKGEIKNEMVFLADTYNKMVNTVSESFDTINQLNLELNDKLIELEKEIQTRRSTEKALKESEEKFRSISEGIADGVAIVQEGQFAWLNRSFARIFGCSISELEGSLVEKVLQPPKEKFPEKNSQGQGFANQRSSAYRVDALHKNGTPLVVDVKYSESVFEGKPALEIIIRDITEKVKAEQEKEEMKIKALSQSKLASIGEIATGVAHEVNQPLTYIKMAFQASLRDIENEQFNLKDTTVKYREALKQIEKISTITEHLRSFGRKDIFEFSAVNLPEALDDSMILMAERIRLKNFIFTRDIEENLPQILGNKMQLEQVFLNLIKNSLDAMLEDKSGEIKISIKRKNNYLETVVADTGPGIDPAVSEEIFSPFITTKSPEKGTGLGLAIAKNIIKAHKGTIECRKEPERGAAFIISLPYIQN